MRAGEGRPTDRETHCLTFGGLCYRWLVNSIAGRVSSIEFGVSVPRDCEKPDPKVGDRSPSATPDYITLL